MNATALTHSIARLLLPLVIGTLTILAVVAAVGSATEHTSSSTTHSVEAGKCRTCI